MTLTPLLTPEQIRADLRLRGITLRVDGDELVVRGRAATTDDIATLKSRKGELITYLVGPGANHRRGPLDERFGLDLDDYGLSPPSPELSELRREYFSWPEEIRHRFDRHAGDLQMKYPRAEAERLAAFEMTSKEKI